MKDQVKKTLVNKQVPKELQERKENKMFFFFFKLIHKKAISAHYKKKKKKSVTEFDMLYHI